MDNLILRFFKSNKKNCPYFHICIIEIDFSSKFTSFLFLFFFNNIGKN